jgi:hypothetical protein
VTALWIVAGLFVAQWVLAIAAARMGVLSISVRRPAKPKGTEAKG